MKNGKIKNRIVAGGLALVICLSMFSGLFSNAAFSKEKAENIAKSTTISKIQAKSYATIYCDIGEISFKSDNCYEHYSVGNMVKLMTMYLTMEAVANGKTGLSSGVEVSKEAQAISVGKERVFLDAGKGEIITVSEALIAICVASANDAAYALAEHISGGTEEDFVKMMNDKAKEMGLENTVFLDSTGIKIIDDGQYSCAADMCVLAYRLVTDYPDILVFTTDNSSVFHHTSTGESDTEMKNSNAFVFSGIQDGADGLLVGYSKADLYAEAGTANIDGERAVAVVIGETTPEYRAAELKFLINYTVEAFTHKTFGEAGTYVRMVSVKHGKTLKAKTCTSGEVQYIENVTENSTYTTRVVVDDNIEAPVSKGDIVGAVIYERVYYKTENGKKVEVTEEIGRVDLVIDEDIDKAGWFTLFLRKILEFFGLMSYS